MILPWLHEDCMKAVFRLYEGVFKAVLRLHEGLFKALSTLQEGAAGSVPAVQARHSPALQRGRSSGILPAKKDEEPPRCRIKPHQQGNGKARGGLMF